MARDPKTAVLLFLAPTLVVITAVIQRTLAETKDLNPWKGGGFGMFADIPKTPYRVLRIQPVDRDRIGYSTPVPRDLRGREEGLRNLPTEPRLRRFAKELVNEEWVMVERDGKRFPVLRREARLYGGSEPLESASLHGIRLELFQYDLEADAPRLVRTLLHRVDVTSPR